MGLFDFYHVRKAASALEDQLLRYRHGGVGIDLPTDINDPTKVDPLFAAAAMRLLKKYGERLVTQRFRARIQISWRESVFGSVAKDNRDRLTGVGFYGGPGDSLEPIDPNFVGNPLDPEVHHQIDAARARRVREWVEQGWKGDPAWEAWGGDPKTVERHRADLAKAASLTAGGLKLSTRAVD